MMNENSSKANSSFQQDLHLLKQDPGVGMNQITKIYKYKLSKLESNFYLKSKYDMFWNLLEHNFEGEIEKKSFINLFTKIYKLILPSFNYDEIVPFLEGEWLLNCKDKASMDFSRFSKYLFKFIHLWCTHINSREYIDFLTMIYDRITKYVTTDANGKETVYHPWIKVRLYKSVTQEEYEEKTWEMFDETKILNKNLYELPPEPNPEGGENKEISSQTDQARPLLKSGYNEGSPFILYSEEIYYKNHGEMKNLELCKVIKPILLNDDEIVIFGYPTQFILTYFRNHIKELKEISVNQESEGDYQFKINDYKNYDKQTFLLKFDDSVYLNIIADLLQANRSIILTRDIFQIDEELEFGMDFVEDELNIFNNLRRNPVLDRKLNFYDVQVPGIQNKIAVNLDHLIINPTYKKALENILQDDKLGVKSYLWSESLYEKIENIIKNKFYLIQIKLLNFRLNVAAYSSVIDIMNKEIEDEKIAVLQEGELDLQVFNKFASQRGIIFDRWDSDDDLIEEANKKSPVVLIIGPPMIGKTMISQQLCKDLDLVHLDPNKFFETIFAKVAEYEEKMLSFDELEGLPPESDWDPNNPPQKKVKPGVDSVLSSLEFDIYTDITSGHGISKENMKRLYNYIIHSDRAMSRGLVIDQNSSIQEDSSFAEKLLEGYYGKVDIDYVIDLQLPREELELRRNTLKFNLKTFQYISARDIELMWKPKVQKKEILEDEIVEGEEEGVVPEAEAEIEISDEEKEKIPKETDLLEITDLDEIFNSQYDYFLNVQYPKIKELISTLKSNYYIPLNLTGLDWDETCDLIKSRLDFVSPPRPIAKELDPADYKTLLTDGREGILPFRRWSLWKQVDPVALKDNYLILNGSTEFPAVFFSRVFLFSSNENRAKFIENPKKYLMTPPTVPPNYRVCVMGPQKTGKSTIAAMLNELFGWKVLDMEEIFENVKEYQKNWEEPEINSVYTKKIHFSVGEFKDIISNLAKKPQDRKPDSFYSKIIFMLDQLGIPLDKKKTLEEFLAERNFHQEKHTHLFRKLEKERQKQREEQLEMERQAELERLETEQMLQKKSEDALKGGQDSSIEEKTQQDADNENVNKEQAEENIQNTQEVIDQNPVVVEEEIDPFPPEDDYVIEDLKSEQFFYAFNNEGKYPRPGGFILMNHPFAQEEMDKFKEFDIVFDKVIYLVDQSDEGIKNLILRRFPTVFNALDEERQLAEIDKVKTEVQKYDEIIGLMKERYNVNNEECVIEINFNDKLEDIKLKLFQILNPFSVRVDPDDKVFSPSDIPLDDKYPASKGEFGPFCPVTYKNERWLFYSPENCELQVNQRLYRFASEKEMEMFKVDPSVYISTREKAGTTLAPIAVPPPHIFFSGYQGAGVTFFTTVLEKEYKFKKRALKSEFLSIWEDQKKSRKQMRIAKKTEELIKKNEEIKANNLVNPDQEPQELLNIENELANDGTLEDEEEAYNAVENDKAIFKSLFYPDTPSIYDATWYDMEGKVPTSLIELMIDTRRVPNVFVIFKVSLKTIMDRHFHMDQIENQHKELVKISMEKRKKREEERIYQKRLEVLDALKEKLDENMAEGSGDLNNSLGNMTGLLNTSLNASKQLPDISTIKIELDQEEKEEIWNSPDPDLIELETLVNQEKEKLSTRYEANMNAIASLIDGLKEKGIPVIEIQNDLYKESVYKNLLLLLEPYIRNRANLIEKYLVNIKINQPDTEGLTLRKIRDLSNNSQVYKLSAYGNLSPVNPQKMIIRADYPMVYRDRIYLFNNDEERLKFADRPLDYRTGGEFPLDSFPIRGRNIIYVIGQLRSGKTTVSKILSEYMGYQRITVRRACMDLMSTLHDCLLKRELVDLLTGGGSIDDNLVIKVLSRRLSMEDLINQNVVIDGFPYTHSQADLLTTIDPTLSPTFIFVSYCESKAIFKRAFSQKLFKGLPEVINERYQDSADHLKDIIKSFSNRSYDIRYFNTEKSLWYIKDLLYDLLEKKKKNELLFSRALSLSQPAMLGHFAPKKIIKDIIFKQHSKSKLLVYSPISLKAKNEFWYNKYVNMTTSNHIVRYPNEDTGFHFLRNDEEVNIFLKFPELYCNYISEIKDDIIPPKMLKFEQIAEVLFTDPEYEDDPNEGEEEIEGPETMKMGLNIEYEYQNCCPVTITNEKLLQEGKFMYSIWYLGKYYKFKSAEKLKRFLVAPAKFANLKVPVKKVMEEENQRMLDKQINFENTVNYLENTFGSLITKGMLELSNNRLKYPLIGVKETSMKYLALFLKANNPNNNAYAKEKYSKKLEEFLKNSKLPFELLKVHENYHKEENNPLRKQLIRKQLDNIANKYDDLMEKAKFHYNTRFQYFFKKQSD